MTHGTIVHERTFVEQIEFASRLVISNSELYGLHRTRFDSYVDYAADTLVLTMRAHVFGKRGDPVQVKQQVDIARLPTWLPRWLRRRWSENREIVLDAQPMLVWPEANVVPPEFGRPVEVVSTRWTWRDGPPEDVLAGWM